MTLKNPGRFFDALRRGGLLGAALDQSEVDGCNAILKASQGLPVAHVAYMLATAYHETAHTMLPIKEYGGPAYFFRMYDIQGLRPDVARRLGNTVPGDGVKYCGRGYPQLTGRANYLRAERELGVPFTTDPDLALMPIHAASIMRLGMVEGWFTTRTLKGCLPSSGPATTPDFIKARKIINGTDRADLIATYALAFQDALMVGFWE